MPGGAAKAAAGGGSIPGIMGGRAAAGTAAGTAARDGMTNGKPAAAAGNTPPAAAAAAAPAGGSSSRGMAGGAAMGRGGGRCRAARLRASMEGGGSRWKCGYLTPLCKHRGRVECRGFRLPIAHPPCEHPLNAQRSPRRATCILMKDCTSNSPHLHAADGAAEIRKLLIFLQLPRSMQPHALVVEPVLQEGRWAMSNLWVIWLHAVDTSMSNPSNPPATHHTGNARRSCEPWLDHHRNAEEEELVRLRCVHESGMSHHHLAVVAAQHGALAVVGRVAQAVQLGALLQYTTRTACRAGKLSVNISRQTMRSLGEDRGIQTVPVASQGCHATAAPAGIWQLRTSPLPQPEKKRKEERENKNRSRAATSEQPNQRPWPACLQCLQVALHAERQRLRLRRHLVGSLHQRLKLLGGR